MYLDTAILVKLFTTEPDSKLYAKRVEGKFLFSSQIAYTEVFSAFLFKERNGLINRKLRDEAWAEFSRCVTEETIHLVPLSPAILTRANRILAEVHPHVSLRSLDAIHLASCDAAQEWPLVTNDRRMREAAEHLRFPLATILS